MRLHRFHITEKVGPQTEIIVHSAELVNQVRKVFRLKTGDSIIVFDGSGSDYECRIADMGKESITLDIQNASRSRYMPSRNVYLYAAMVKKDTFEWIAEKATELGVTHIIPVMAERSEKKNINEARLAKIVIEASEQSGRGSIPVILPIESLLEAIDPDDFNGSETLNPKSEILNKFKIRNSTRELRERSSSRMTANMKKVAFHTEGESLTRPHLDKDQDIAIFIGPEGGWSPDELELFHKNNIPVVCLGTQVLRAETAVVAALSVVMLGE